MTPNTNTKQPMQSTPADPPGGDPSMEDILASIRRILSEDEAQPAAVPKSSAEAAPASAGPVPAGPVPAIPQPPAAGAPETVQTVRETARETGRGSRGTGTPDVLVLDSSMMVQEPPVTPPDPVPAPTPLPRPAEPVQGVPAPVRAVSQPAVSAQPAGPSKPPAAEPSAQLAQLVAPEAAAAAASSVGTLMRTLAAERGAAVSRGGPTIEDLVREELRPMLKTWLDTYLPPLVERLVRAEIERVVGHTAL